MSDEVKIDKGKFNIGDEVWFIEYTDDQGSFKISKGEVLSELYGLDMNLEQDDRKIFIVGSKPRCFILYYVILHNNETISVDPQFISCEKEQIFEIARKRCALYTESEINYHNKTINPGFLT